MAIKIKAMCPISFSFNSFALHKYGVAFHEGLWQYLNAVKYSEYTNSERREKKRSAYSD